MRDDEKREVLSFLIADAEKILNIYDDGPLEDDFISLKNYYTELEEKILSSQGNVIDLSEKSIVPEKSFFLYENNTIYPFSTKDIPILLQNGKNPYTSTVINKDKIKKIKEVLDPNMEINIIGGMLEVISGLEDQSAPEINYVKELQKRAEKILKANTFVEICKEISNFTENEIKYTASSFLWNLYNMCQNNVYPTDIETIEYLLDKGTKFDIVKAVSEDNIVLAELLLKTPDTTVYEQDPRVEDEVIGTPSNRLEFLLEQGALDSNVKLVQFALENETNEIHIDRDLLILNLYEACKNNSLEIVKLLMQRYLKYDNNNNIRRTFFVREEALHLASERGYTEIVRFLLDSGANIHINDDWALRDACEHGYVETARLLLERGADANAMNVLRKVAKNGPVEIVQLLLEYGTDVHINDDKALILAARYDNTKIVELLLHFGANILAQGNEALKMACKYAKLDTIKVLLENGANVHINHDEPLFLAVKRDNVQIAKLLLEYGADTRAREFLREASSKPMKHLLIRGS